MISGTNTSQKEFDVTDEDGDVLGSFDHHGDAVQCLRAAPWYGGDCRIRRDMSFAVAPVTPGWTNQYFVAAA